MLDILKSIYHDDLISLEVICRLEEPQTAEERKVRTQLRAMDEDTAAIFMSSIEELADRQSERAFYSGVRFGAQLMRQILEEFS